MPALQVRDFPEELYEQLKACAEREHRSIAQQTIVAVERMVRTDEGFGRRTGESSDKERVNSFIVGLDTESERAARIKKRTELFERIKASKDSFPDDMPDPVTIVRQVREERDRDMHRLARQMMDEGDWE